MVDLIKDGLTQVRHIPEIKTLKKQNHDSTRSSLTEG